MLERTSFLLCFCLLAATAAMADEKGEDWGFHRDVNEELYAQACAACHGERLEGGPLGATLIKPGLKHGNSLEDIIDSIANGFPEQGMPAAKETLEDPQIRRLAMLILELQAGFTYDSVDPLGVPLEIPTAVQSSEHHRFRLASVAEGLQHPFSIAPLPDGRILFTEKSVGLSLLSADGREKTLVKGTPRVYDDNTFRGSALIGSGWLLEVALHPDYEKNGWIYLSYGDRCSDCNALSKSTGKPVTMTALVRGRIEGDRWLDEQAIWRVDTNHYLTGHNQAAGARIAFDDEGHLFFSVGGISQEGGIQDLDRPYGKIHRVLDNGRIPSGNPFADVPGAIRSTWSLGHRNPQGLAFDKKRRTLWETEHGPRGGDELNLILPSHNYGWPMVSFGMWYDGTPIRFAEKLGIEYDPKDLTYPVKHWTPSPAISSAVFQLLRLEIENGEVVHEEILLDGLGRFRDVEVGPDGNLYLLVEQYHGSHIVKLSPAR
ncbi:MAG: PQQ-dependent sugar dehydrogenase [Deltaproteobacteria bacterium]|nr:PQQ-dependent sugar dehydrogenase [Deltaproteobacteria bacterium]